MADSIDRVFVHALNTVKKLPRTGSSRPPPEDRLKLYGLYKQSMEGDVDRIMNKPEGTSEESVTEGKKWDAWHSQHGISKTEAKRRYITTLIDAMHRYATTTPDAVELVSELEFVWDQIKSNVPSSSSSSPVEILGGAPPIYPVSSDTDLHLNPLSPSADFDENGEEEYEEYNTSDEFDEHGLPRMHVLLAGAEDDNDGETYDEASPIEPNKRQSSQYSPNKSKSTVPGEPPRNPAVWRRRVEQALTKMTAEVAALREQLELRRSMTAAASTNLALMRRWVVYVAWVSLKHVIIDGIFVALVVAWMKRRGDKRAELVVKLILGFMGERIPWRRGRKVLTQVGKVGEGPRSFPAAAS